MSRALENLHAGLTTIRPWMLVCSVVLAGGLLLALEAALARGLIWKLPVEWVLAAPYDGWSHASWQIHRLQRDVDAALPVVFLGGSAVREAVSDDRSMSAALSTRAGAPVRFVNLGTRGQNLAERLLLVDQLPRVERGLVVFSMHPMFLRDGPDEWSIAAKGVRFPLASPAVKDALATIAPGMSADSGWNVVRFRPLVRNWIWLRMAERSLFRPMSYTNHLYGDRGPMSNRDLADAIHWLDEQMLQYPTYRDANLELLERAVSLARARGYRVILIDLPRNPLVDRALFQKVLPDYSRALSQLAHRLDVPYLDMHAQLRFRRRDFYDHIHFLHDSRPRFEAAFMQQVLPAAARY